MKQWIKLWTRMLDDPKVGVLDDRAFRVLIEFLLLAGQEDKGGFLPPADEMAWRLRRGLGEVKDMLVGLERVKILAVGPEGRFFFLNWEEYQAPEASTERVRQWRDRNAAKRLQGVTPATDGNAAEENRTEKKRGEGRPIPPAVLAYREAAHRFPNKSLWERMDTVLGTDPAVMVRWKEHVVGWIARGWNPANLQGLMESFSKPKGEAPFEGRQADGTGEAA